MPKRGKILLISNYRQDRQFSMLKFEELILENSVCSEDFRIKNIFPLPLFGKLPLPSKFIKWASYIDKFLIFPQRFSKYLKLNPDIRLFHIIDHSNSPYLKRLINFSSAKRLITCHDLIAVRTALGDFPNAPKTSTTGKRLQNWIQYSLPLADFYACDSEETKKDLNRIVKKSLQCSKVIHLGTGSDSVKKSYTKSLNSEICFDHGETNYILHVGSAAWYKNRMAVFKSFLFAKNHPCGKNLKLILVGPLPQPHEINPELSTFLAQHSSDVIFLQNISSDTLNSLYFHAKLFLFPSFIEGFGWPPLEAASQGCSVITTLTGAIYDLLGDNARYVDSSFQHSINMAVCDELEKEYSKPLKVSLPCNTQCRANYYQLYRDLLRR